jgi:hypothetical protein
MVELLTLLLHIREVPNSNLVPEMAVLTDVIVAFLIHSRRMPGQYLKIRP